MKTVSLFLTAAMLFVAPVVHAKMIQVPDAQAKELKAALALTNFACSGNLNVDSVKDLIRSSDAVYLDEAGAQPVLKFTKPYDYSNDRVLFTLTTTADFKKIGLLLIEDQKMTPINYGSLVKPQIKNEYITSKKFECK